MANKELIAKLANIPLANSGFNALDMSAPFIIQMNPEGNWENSAPDNLDEDKLKAVVQHLLKTQALSAAQSYCCQCAAESQKDGGQSNYVPVIMMPIYPADQCPFDMECEVQKMKDSTQPKTKKAKQMEQAKETEKDKTTKKTKKRGFVMQRLTDFDLLSQW